jgi:hypothetical protein
MWFAVLQVQSASIEFIFILTRELTGTSLTYKFQNGLRSQRGLAADLAFSIPFIFNLQRSAFQKATTSLSIR